MPVALPTSSVTVSLLSTSASSVVDMVTVKDETPPGTVIVSSAEL